MFPFVTLQDDGEALQEQFARDRIKHNIYDFEYNPGFLSYSNIDDVIQWMRESSEKINREVVAYELTDCKGEKKYYIMPWNLNDDCNNYENTVGAPALKMELLISKNVKTSICPLALSGRLHTHNSCSGSTYLSKADLNLMNAMCPYFGVPKDANGNYNFNQYVIGKYGNGVGLYNEANGRWNYKNRIIDSNKFKGDEEYEINLFRQY